MATCLMPKIINLMKSDLTIYRQISRDCCWRHDCSTPLTVEPASADLAPPSFFSVSSKCKTHCQANANTILLCVKQNAKHTVHFALVSSITEYKAHSALLLVSSPLTNICTSPADCTGHCSVTAQKTATHLIRLFLQSFFHISCQTIEKGKRESASEKTR